MAPLRRTLRNYMITGVLVLAPLAITLYILAGGFSILDDFLGAVADRLLGRSIPGAGAVLTLALTLLVGMIATNVVGKKMIAWGDRILNRIPIVRAVYSSVKQLIDAFAMQGRSGFQRVVLVEYPRRGVWSVAFVTNQGGKVIESALADDSFSTVFIPTSPNPTSGYLLVVQASDMVPLDLSVENAFKLIVSGGVVMPDACTGSPKEER